MDIGVVCIHTIIIILFFVACAHTHSLSLFLSLFGFDLSWTSFFFESHDAHIVVDLVFVGFRLLGLCSPCSTMDFYLFIVCAPKGKKKEKREKS
jgi:hypothetical protein